MPLPARPALRRRRADHALARVRRVLGARALLALRPVLGPRGLPLGAVVRLRELHDQGGYTFVEHDKAVGANGLVSSRLTNCCMTRNSAWVAEFDRLSCVYKLNFKEKCAFARKYAATSTKRS